MPPDNFALPFIDALMQRTLASQALNESCPAPGTPHLELENAAEAGTSAGYVRLWQGAAPSRLDRMVHARLISAPAETHLFFIYGLASTAVPHFHAQVVQFAPDACVYNADLLPRLDPIDYPQYYRDVFEPLTRPFQKATQNKDNVCALIPANPALAAYLSPWGIGAARPTDRAELERVTPQIMAYLEHYLVLADELGDGFADADLLRTRNERHLDAFMAEELDPRAWKGVYRIVGKSAGEALRSILRDNLR